MQDLESDPLGEARADSRSLLQRGFAESRIDLKEFEERLVLVRSARTPAELQRVTFDLAPPPEPTPQPIVEHPGRVIAGRPAPSALVSVFGSQERRGVWRPAKVLRVVSVFGNNELDLRRAVLEPGLTEITAVSVFGNIEIVVPPGLYVIVEGLGIFGSFEQMGEGLGDPPPGKPAVLIRGSAVFGVVEVKVRELSEGGTRRERRRERYRRLRGR